jgi:hypothetical protein
LILSLMTTTVAVQGAIIVDDSWADGGRDDGADPQDSNWWTSSASSGIEVSVGSLGMVTGGSGRGIHTVFPTQSLAVNQRLIATYTFTTPATVGAGGTAGFRVGLFDTLGRAGLNADVSASSGSPNAVYGYFVAGTVGLPGYMMDMDVNSGATADLNFRQLDTPVNVPAQTPTGRLMGTTTGFTSFTSGPDAGYSFAANTTYTGSLTLHRIDDTQMRVSGTLGNVTHSVTDAFDSADVGMLAFWSNSNLFGSSSTPNTPDNGIDFSNVRIEIVPEPSAVMLVVVGVAILGGHGLALGRLRRMG